MTEKINWIRKIFKTKKVWVAYDENGKLLLEKGKAQIKFEIEQSAKYLAKPENIKPIDFVPENVEDENSINVYTDGASKGNPGNAGIGILLKYKGKKKEISEYIGIATNNIAELTAIQKALLSIKNKKLPVNIYSDSSYAIGVLSKNWKAKENQELILEIQELLKEFSNLKFNKVAGHCGIESNEIADRLANEGANKGN